MTAARDLARVFLRASHNWLSDDVAFTLAILAVSDHYRLEVDNQGFRAQFTEALLGREDVAAWQERLGPAIEGAIIGWSGQPPRQGAWRYVGLVREQAGIGRYHLPRLAHLLDILQRQIGWRNLGRKPLSDLDGLIRATLGDNLLVRYLTTPTGRARLLAIAHDLVLWQDGVLPHDRLGGLCGYPADFLPDLIRQLASSPDDEPSHAEFGEPTLRLDLETGRIQLCFDDELVLRGRIQCDQWPGSLWHSRLTLGEHLPFKERYSGRTAMAQDNVPWEATGWTPTTGNWILFNEQGRLVGSRQTLNTVGEGIFYLVTDTEPAGWTAHHGLLDTGDEWSHPAYEIYEVAFPGGTLPEGLSLDDSASGRLRFELLGAAPWSSFAGVDGVWTEGPPRIHLHNWNEYHHRRNLILLRTPAGIEHLEVAPNETGSVDLPLPPLPTPCVCELWLQPIGCQRNTARQGPRLRLALWPWCDVRALQGLYEENAQPEIHLQLPPQVQLEPGLASLQQVEGRWCAARHVSLVGFRLTCADHTLHLQMPLHRARLKEAGQYTGTLVLEHQMFTTRQAAAREARLTITARPALPVDLLLQNMDGEELVLLRGRRLAPSGQTLLQPSEIADALRDEAGPLGRFWLRQGSQAVPTNTWHLRSAALTASVLGSQSPLTDGPACVLAGVRVIEALRDGTGPPLACDGAKTAPTEWNAIIADWWRCAQSLEGWPTPPDAWRSPHAQLTSILNKAEPLLELIDRCDIDTSPAEAQAWLAQWKQLDLPRQLQEHGLNLPRWLEKLAEKEARLTDLASVQTRLADWLRRPGGDLSTRAEAPIALRNAGEYYLQAHLRPGAEAAHLGRAAQTLRPAIQGMTGLWKELAVCLLPLIYLRLAEISAFLDQAGAATSLDYCQAASAELHWIAANLRGAAVTSLPISAAAGLTQLSPRSDDQQLVAAIRGERDWREAARVSWAGAWLGWRYHMLTGAPAERTAELYDALQAHIHHLPRSLDRVRIEGEIRSQVPEHW